MAAEVVIRAGGVLVLAAVLGICVYLIGVTLPLFEGGTAASQGQPRTIASAPPIFAAADERSTLIATLTPDASLAIWQARTGAEVARSNLVDASPDAASPSIAVVNRAARDGLTAIGFTDGTILKGTIQLRSELLLPADITQQLRQIDPGTSSPWTFDWAQHTGLVTRENEDDFRFTTADLDLKPLKFEEGLPPATHLSYQQGPRGNQFLAVRRTDGTVTLSVIRTTRSLAGGDPIERISTRSVPIDPQSPVAHLFVGGDGRDVFAIQQDGTCHHFDAPLGRDPIVLAETIDLTPGTARLTTADMAIGGISLLLGDDQGTLHVAFPARSPDDPDDRSLTVARRIRVGANPISAIEPGSRDRTVAVADASGHIGLFHLTSGKRIVSLEAPADRSIARLALAPRTDALFAFAPLKDATEPAVHVDAWSLDLGHAEASVATLFAPVKYEGQSDAQFVYQSSSGDDAAEPKISLVPLIFGTIKATIYAALFAIPIAVMGAIYTREFLHPRARNIVKPAMEMMASLPSVVLGFIAAMVLAPWLGKNLPGVVLALLLVPTVSVVSAHVWQHLPPRIINRPHSVTKLALLIIIALATAACSILLGPAFDAMLFRPSESELQTLGVSLDQAMGFRAWLDGQFGGPFPGWLLIFLFPSSLLIAIAKARWISRPLTKVMAGLSRPQSVLADAGVLAAAILLTVALAAAAAALFSGAGLDPRNSIFGPFELRNTAVVALIMGFAIIPIIYTISEDAIASVPDSLRSASLGAGATPWQTAIRVVLPVALSGIFSACMIGLGRAVGETMIVLMATGNTPTMDWNIFSGFRTLAANIAVELPEAPRQSTHYRVLFLCGLVLFTMTFVINTSAELVRQRVRKRNAAL